MLTIACVQTGTRYGSEYVTRLQAGVRRHLSRPHRFVRLTDQVDELDQVESIQLDHPLPGWWAKLRLFDPQLRGAGRWIFMDLDTVVTGSLDPLADLEVPFGVCESFTRHAGNALWPCLYGSCVMTWAEGFGNEVWDGFQARAEAWMAEYARLGDQKVIEELCPDAALLQELLPQGFFLNYRDFSQDPPTGPFRPALLIFGGHHKPANTPYSWVRDSWKGASHAGA